MVNTKLLTHLPEAAISKWALKLAQMTFVLLQNDRLHIVSFQIFEIF